MGVIKVGKRNEVFQKRNVASDKAVKKEMLERDDNTEFSLNTAIKCTTVTVTDGKLQ